MARILIIEDDKDIVKLVGYNLPGASHRLTEADALTYSQAVQPIFCGVDIPAS